MMIARVETLSLKRVGARWLDEGWLPARRGSSGCEVHAPIPMDTCDVLGIVNPFVWRRVRNRDPTRLCGYQRPLPATGRLRRITSDPSSATRSPFSKLAMP